MGKTELPVDGSFLDNAFHGTLRLVRRFGRPTNLGPAERVHLVIESTGASLVATLNGLPLGESPALPERVDITAGLLPRNELVIEVALPGEFALMDVRLEMHDLPVV
jgi:hypothetical protein